MNPASIASISGEFSGLAPYEDLGGISPLRAPAIRRLLRERRFDPE